MRNLLDCKEEIRNQIKEKQKKKAIKHKRMVFITSVLMSALICCAVVLFININTNQAPEEPESKVIRFESLEQTVRQSKLIFIGTFQQEQQRHDNDASASEDNDIAEYVFSIETIIAGYYTKDTIAFTQQSNISDSQADDASFVIGERYVVFLSRVDPTTAVASGSQVQYVKTPSPLSILHVEGDEIDVIPDSWKDNDGAPFTKKIDDLVLFILDVKEKG